MATFTAKPTEGQDPWGATDLAWRASVESAVNTVEGTANAAATKSYADAIKATADAALPVKGALGTLDLNGARADGVWTQDNGANGTLARNYPFEGFAGSVERVSVGSRKREVAVPTAGNANGRGVYVRSFNATSWSSWVFVPSQRVDNSAGRAVYTWDPTANREQLVYGDTGERALTLPAELTGASVLVMALSRQTGFVTFNLQGLTCAAGSVIATLPPGFRPPRLRRYAISLATGLTASLSIAPSGAVTVTQALAVGAEGNFETTWRTFESWPTVLPGTASGTIPNA